MNTAQQRTAEGALFTDMYQLTMAQLYVEQGIEDTPAQFEYFFRSYPDYGSHKAGYCVTAGLSWLLDWMERARFGEREIELLRSTRDRRGEPLFREPFLEWLVSGDAFARIDLEAIPEGRVVHAGEPVAVARGPLAAAQLLETSLLNHLNYPTLVATKAARVKQAARGSLVLDFGMRRGHERGVNAGTRAALIGGVDGTSNTGLAYQLGLEPQGTHAHSMVQAFMALGGAAGEGELAAFRAYADAYPDDCLLLVDTIDTLGSGVPNAITVFEELREAGREPVGIRLDSGDLAHLAIQSARMLDEAGFGEATIVLSNQLDEYTIWQIVTQIRDEADAYGVDADALTERLSYGVGTNLMISQGDSALDGVYKLVALETGDGWTPAVKLSDSASKVLTPGEKRVWRVYDERGKATADLVAAADEEPGEGDDDLVLHHPDEHQTRRTLPRARVSRLEPLLEPAMAGGRRCAERADLETLRARCRADLDALDPGVRRLLNPHIYHVSLSERLWDQKLAVVREARDEGGADA